MQHVFVDGFHRCDLVDDVVVDRIEPAHIAIHAA